MILPHPAVAAVYQPPEPFTVKTFTGANESWFIYPELTNPGTSNYSVPELLAKPNFGIAISGGGFRAATLGLGWLRALHIMNFTSSARYLSSNSGGTWLNSAYSFQKNYTLEHFLGTYIPPEDLTLEVLGATDDDNASFAATIAKASILARAALGNCPRGVGVQIGACTHRHRPTMAVDPMRGMISRSLTRIRSVCIFRLYRGIIGSEQQCKQG
jgi:hypothetical protein